MFRYLVQKLPALPLRQFKTNVAVNDIAKHLPHSVIYKDTGTDISLALWSK